MHNNLLSYDDVILILYQNALRREFPLLFKGIHPLELSMLRGRIDTNHVTKQNGQKILVVYDVIVCMNGLATKEYYKPLNVSFIYLYLLIFESIISEY